MPSRTEARQCARRDKRHADSYRIEATERRQKNAVTVSPFFTPVRECFFRLLSLAAAFLFLFGLTCAFACALLLPPFICILRILFLFFFVYFRQRCRSVSLISRRFLLRCLQRKPTMAKRGRINLLLTNNIWLAIQDVKRNTRVL